MAGALFVVTQVVSAVPCSFLVAGVLELLGCLVAKPSLVWLGYLAARLLTFISGWVACFGGYSAGRLLTCLFGCLWVDRFVGGHNRWLR